METLQLENFLATLNNYAFTTDVLHKVLALNGFKTTKSALESVLEQYFNYFAVRSARYYWRTTEQSKTLNHKQLTELWLEFIS